MWTELHWVEGPWLGKLALASRPRGGDWLPEEMQQWHAHGVDTVVSLLTSEEERDLDITAEAIETSAHGMKFVSFPIPDREVPVSRARLQETLSALDHELGAGRNVLLHCRQGIGRTGLVASCLLLRRGMDPETAVRKLNLARGTAIPETEEQRLWIHDYASSLAS